MTLSGRSSAEWGSRLLLATIAMFLAYIVVTRTLATVLVSREPQRAYMIAPNDGRIAGTWSAYLSGITANQAQPARSDAVARSALLRDPTAVAAVATLGLNAQVRGDTARARQIFAYSAKLSRRDLRTQLWTIEDAVDRNDVPAALRQYDITLRTARSGGELLYPILASAITDPNIRRELIRTLDAGTPWGNDFVIYAAAASRNPKAIVQLLTGMKQAGIIVPESAQQRAVDALIGAADFDNAWSYYSSIRFGADRSGSRDSRFTGGYAAPTQFDWTVIDTDGTSSTIQADPQGGRFDFVVSGNAQGALLRQVQLLSAGNYALEGKVVGIDPSNGVLPYWLLSCRDGRELGRVEIATNGRFTGTMRVPAQGCVAQTLTLMARPSNEIPGVAGQVTEARLRPVQR